MNFKFINYTENVLEICLQNWREKTLFLFPNEISSEQAFHLSQQLYGITNSGFMTIEQWKNEIFISKLPIVLEEKRTLLWYLSLSQEDKDFFHITDYSHAIQPALQFFNFWDEINEELVEINKIHETISHSFTANEQILTFLQLEAIYFRYQSLLSSKYLTDQIFIKKMENVDYSMFLEYEKLIVVNQFYFTNLEKKLFELSPFKEKTIFLQLPEAMFDKKNMAVFKNAEFWKNQNLQTKAIYIHEANHSQEMILQLAEVLSTINCSAIVDFRLRQQSYFTFLSRKKFQISSKQNLLFTQPGQFLTFLLTIVKSIKKTENQILISLESMIKAFMQPDFFTYFQTGSVTFAEVNKVLQDAAEQSFIYLDLEGAWLSFFTINPELKNYFHSFSAWLHAALKIRSLADFIVWLDSEKGLLVSQLISDKEKKYSDFSDVFSDAIADFSTLDYLIERENWDSIFPKHFFTGFLELFAQYLKAKSIRFSYEESSTQCKFIQLQDTRNMQFETLAMLNIVEGVLPATHRTPFLFSESQRNESGLKTYEDVLLRDKYYFYRALAQSKEVHLFTIRNIDDNIEPSSYLQELEWILPEKITLFKHKQSVSLISIYKPLENIKLPEIPDDFFTVPFSEKDFPEQKILLTAYPFMQLCKDSFQYYWNCVLKIKPKITKIPNDFEAKFIGNFAHEIFAEIWQRILSVYQGNQAHHHFSFTNTLYVEDAIEHYQKHHKKFAYISPHNFANVYFQYILLPFIKECVTSFFSALESRFQLSDVFMTLYPEVNSAGKIEAKKWFTVDKDWDVFIKAKSDLRIETYEKKYIFDYKTSSLKSGDKKSYQYQLALYEYYYYLLGKSSGTIESYLYFVLDKAFYPDKPMKREEFLYQLPDEIKDIFSTIFAQGYQLAAKKYMYEDVDITRRDLYQRMER